MALANFNALLRQAAEPSVDGPWNTIGRFVACFTPQEYANYFATCGYDAD